MKVTRKILVEDTPAEAKKDAISQDQVKDIEDGQKVLGPKIDVEDEVGDIEKTLTEALETALEAKKAGTKNWYNVLFIGLAGVAKTGRISAWAKAHNVNLVTQSASSMDRTDLGGAAAPDMERKRVIKLGTDEFNELDEIPSVLFLDEFNRASHDIRGTLLTLIQDHTIPDPNEKNHLRYLKNFLFTVAAINPSEDDLRAMHREFNDEWGDYDPEYADAYNVDTLDPAELTRFIRQYVIADPRATYNYFEGVFNQQIQKAESENDERMAKRARGRLALADKLLHSPRFSFDGPKDIMDSRKEGNGLILNPRTLELCLVASNGTKEDFLKKFKVSCNNTRLEEIESILANYKDVEDKANQVLQKGTDSKLINKGLKNKMAKAIDAGVFD